MNFWRVRLRVSGQRDFSEEAWERNEIGIWYGAWTCEDLKQARSVTMRPEDVRKYLNDMPAQLDLGWEVTESHFNTIIRFESIAEDDWIVVYLAQQHKLGLAQVESQFQSTLDHPFNNWDDGGEIFKYRKIRAKKSFEVSELPDAYRLLSSQGRSNVHEFHGMRGHVDLLVQCETVRELQDTIRAMPFDKLLDFYGASGWESFCFAYLIMEQKFVPTGLSIGRTLKDFDIVGRARTDGRRIVAQCKKHPTPQPIDRSFLSAITPQDIAYYFAYGGISDEVPSGTIIVTGADARNWAMSHSNGQLYRKLLLGEPV
ncbi:MAG TPA: hypothetical protein VK522_06910 [Pseudolabrys sp.]|nr:hypothetical protein [Pseudolabrys sp.]